MRTAARRLESALLSAGNLLPLAAAAVYLVNRFASSLDFVLPYGFAHYQLGDLCGGIIFPAYVNVLALVVSGKNAVTGLRSSLALSAVCSLCWEFVAPCIFGYGTADALDVLMYFVGGLVYLAGFRVCEKLKLRCDP